MENDTMQELQTLRAKVEELLAKAERYDGAGLGDVLARLDRMEAKLTPAPSRTEVRIQKIMEKTGCSRAEATKRVEANNRFWQEKRKREGDWKNPLK